MCKLHFPLSKNLFPFFEIKVVMKSKIQCLLIVTCFCSFVRGQQVDESRGSLLPSEKIHIHTDKDLYLPGETIWFKVYLMAGYLPDSIHTNLYTDLVDQNGTILQHKILPVADATTNGSFVLKDSLSMATFFIRAYTENMDADLVYNKRIDVLLKTKAIAPITKPLQSSLQFFPEGGTFINNVVNQLSFRASLSNGSPFEIKAVVKTTDGNVIDSIKTVHDGMGVLSITPHTNEHYYAEWTDNNGEIKQTALPEAVNNGITLHTEQVNNYLYYVIQEPVAEGSLDSIHISASMHQKEIYAATINMTMQPVVSGRIPLSAFPTGILQLTAYDNNKHPLAERMNFINNSFGLDLTISATQNMGKREKNTIDIDMPDTTSSNLSLSVYEAGFHADPSTNIFTDMLLGGDIKGYVHNPAWYFAVPSPERKKALDLVMQTNGWRRYKNSNPSVPANENYITLSGVATDEKNVPQAKQSISLLLQQKDSTKQFYTVVTDDNGRFFKKGIIFYDTATVWYQFKKKELPLKVAFDPVFSTKAQTAPVYVPYVPAASAKTIVETTILPEQFLAPKIADGFTDKGYTLKAVTVKSRQWRNNPMLLMDDKYSTGIFRGGATSSSFDVMNDPMANAKGDIMNYLLGKVPGLTLEYPRGGRTGGLKRLMYRGAPLSLIFIDEHQFQFDPSDGAAYSEIQNLNIADIAYIKFFDKYPLEPDKPALAIYLKKGDEIDGKHVSVLPKLKVGGYSIVKEFYSPDYSIPDSKQSATDMRTTLYWQPYIILDKNNHKATITFYNNDVSSSLYIVLEGMNEAGKLIHMEQRIGEKK